MRRDYETRRGYHSLYEDVDNRYDVLAMIEVYWQDGVKDYNDAWIRETLLEKAS